MFSESGIPLKKPTHPNTVHLPTCPEHRSPPRGMHKTLNPKQSAGTLKQYLRPRIPRGHG